MNLHACRPITIFGTDYKRLYTCLAALQNGKLDLHFYLNQSTKQVKTAVNNDSKRSFS